MQQVRLVGDYLAKTTMYCHENKARFVVLSIPQATEVILGASEGLDGNYDINFVDSRLGILAPHYGFQWIRAFPSLVEHYKKHKERLYYPLDQHLNQEGNRFLGKFFCDQLINAVPALFGDPGARNPSESSSETLNQLERPRHN